MDTENMSEEKQEDLSMEDILSSIKNILDKDSGADNTTSEPAETEEPQVDLLLDEDEKSEADDVFDLSQSMIIEDEAPVIENSNHSATDSDDVDLNLDDTNSNLSTPDLSSDQASPLAEVIADSADDTDILDLAISDDNDSALNKVLQSDDNPAVADDDVLNLDADNVLDLNTDDVLDLAPDTATDHTLDLDVTSDDDVLDLSTVTEDEPTVISGNLLVDDNKIATDVEDTSVAVPVETASASSVSDSETPDLDQSQNDEKVTVNEQNNLSSTTEEPSANEKENDAADVSADIINNFAKIFAEQKEALAQADSDSLPEPELTPELTADQSTPLLGNGSLTIENVVENVIRNIIASSVSAEIATNVDIVSFAKIEIAKQTKEWLNANLPAIVENTVHKEIERVMAKVGK